MDAQTHLTNVIGASFTAGVLLEYIEGVVAVAGGLAIIWYNVEKALDTRRERQKKGK